MSVKTCIDIFVLCLCTEKFVIVSRKALILKNEVPVLSDLGAIHDFVIVVLEVL